MKKALPNHFTKFYEQYCRDNKVKSKVHLLDNNHLKINVDRLDKDDWSPIIEALQKYSYDLHTITIYSVYLNKFKKFRSSRLKETQINCEPALLQESIIKAVTKTLAVCIAKSDILCSLHLEALPLSNYLKIINPSISDNKNLQHLALTYCNLSEEDIVCICRVISNHIGIKTINLTGCGITNKSARHISALIRAQKLVRYGETWKQSLRYRLPNPDVVPGLQRLTLNDNLQIGDEGFKIITYELFDDLWISAIDFQNCGITNLSTEIAFDLIEKNHIIKVLDLRRNDISDDVVQSLMLILQNDQGDNVYNWINSNATHSNTIISGEKSGRRTQSASNNIQRAVKSLNEVERLKVKSNIVFDKAQSQDVIGELRRTKSILHKVSGKLYEEKNKREALEKQYVEFKDQLNGIRTYLENYNTQETEGSSQSATLSTNKKSIKTNIKKKKSTNKIKQSKDIKPDNTLVHKKNDNSNSSNSEYIYVEPTQTTQMFLMIPKQTRNSYSKRNCYPCQN